MRVAAVIGVCLIIGTSTFCALSPIAAALREGRPLTGIVLGTDWVDYSRHSDTLLFWRYNPVTRRTDVVSIPRDTKIKLPGYRFNRINEVFAYHYGVTRNFHQAGSEVVKAVDHILDGQKSNLSPAYYLHIGYEGFRKFVDLLGGVRVQINEPMHYDDEAGNYHFHKDPGTYRLNGHEALNYVRFRGRSGDRGRILRQMEFLKAVSAKISSPLLYIRAPHLFIVIFKKIHTNLQVFDIFSLAMEAKHFKRDRVNPWILPGRPEKAYWIMDKERTSLVLQQIAKDSKENILSKIQPKKDIITVKVWNGTEKKGLALSATRRLRAAKFDVLDYGNYKGRQSITRVMDRVGTIEKARKVARALGVESVFSDVNPKARADVEVILGNDYKLETRN